MAQNFTLATNLKLDRPDPLAPMPIGVPVVLFEEVVAGSASDQTHNACRVFVHYRDFGPDTSPDANGIPQNTPYRFGVMAILEQKQEDESWEEIGRQNAALSELHSGPEREIYVSPQPTSNEEGIDIVAVGLLDQNIKLKSSWQDDASGSLRVRIVAMQGLAGGEASVEDIANPFEFVTVSVSGSRFTV